MTSSKKAKKPSSSNSQDTITEDGFIKGKAGREARRERVHEAEGSVSIDPGAGLRGPSPNGSSTPAPTPSNTSNSSPAPNTGSPAPASGSGASAPQPASGGQGTNSAIGSAFSNGPPPGSPGYIVEPRVSTGQTDAREATTGAQRAQTGESRRLAAEGAAAQSKKNREAAIKAQLDKEQTAAYNKKASYDVEARRKELEAEYDKYGGKFVDTDLRERREASMDEAVRAKKEEAEKNGETFTPEMENQVREEAGKAFDKQEEENERSAAEESLNAQDAAERNRLRDERFAELMKDGNMSRDEALEQANKDADKMMEKNKRQREREKHEAEMNTPEAIQKRMERTTTLFNGIKSFASGLGKAAEGINKGLDLVGTVLKGMLNPSPLGFNEAQTMISATSEAFSLADELVQGVVKKGNEAIGKRIVNNMGASMGRLINENFGGRNINDMTPAELDRFADQLAEEWQPFINRLEIIGTNNPAGAALAEKFKTTFESIKNQGKTNKDNLRWAKKDKEMRIRAERRFQTELKEDKIKDLLSDVRATYMEFAGPVLPSGKPNPYYDPAKHDPKKELFWNIANRVTGKDTNILPGWATDPNTPPEYRYFAFAFDPALMQDGVPTKTLANKVRQDIAQLMKNNPAEYNAHKKEYDELFSEMNAIVAQTKFDVQMGEAAARYGYAVPGQRGSYADEGSAAPMTNVIDRVTLSKKDYRLNPDNFIAGRFPRDKAQEVYNTASKACQDLFAIKNRTPEQERMYVLAKNTMDAAEAVMRIDMMEKQLRKITTMWDKNQPLTNADGSPKLDNLGRQMYASVEFPDSLKNGYVNRMREALAKQIANTAFEVDDIPDGEDPNNFRSRFVTSAPGQNEMYDELLKIQRELRDTTEFPNMIGDPEVPYARRVGTMELIGAMNRLGNEMMDENLSNTVAVIRNLHKVGEGLGVIDPNGNVVSQFTDNLRQIKDITRESRDLLRNLGDRIPDEGARQKFISDLTNEISAMMGKQLEMLKDPKITASLSETDRRKLDALASIGGELNDTLTQLSDPNRFPSGDSLIGIDNKLERIVQMMERGNDGSPQPPAEEEQPDESMGEWKAPEWYDRNKIVSAALAWENMHGGIEDWPSDQYAKNFTDLMGLIKHMGKADNTKPQLQSVARKALVRYLVGSVVIDPDTGEYKSEPIRQRGEKDPMQPTLWVDGDKLMNNWGPVMIPDDKSPNGQREATKDDYQNFLKGLYAIQNGLVDTSDLSPDVKKKYRQGQADFIKKVIALSNSGAI